MTMTVWQSVGQTIFDVALDYGGLTFPSIACRICPTSSW